MKWTARLHEIARLKEKHKRAPYRNALPDLSVEQRTAPCSNRFAPTLGKKQPIEGVKQFPIGNNHKSGTMLVTEGMVKNNELQYLSGRKT